MDYSTSKSNFTRKFAVDFPTSAEWKIGGVLQDDTVFFTVGPKMVDGVGKLLFSEVLSTLEAYR